MPRPVRTWTVADAAYEGRSGASRSWKVNPPVDAPRQVGVDDHHRRGRLGAAVSLPGFRVQHRQRPPLSSMPRLPRWSPSGDDPFRGPPQLSDTLDPAG